MKRKAAVAFATALIMVLATAATAAPARAEDSRVSVEVEPVRRIFDEAGNPMSQRLGVAVLKRSENQLSAFATTKGLKPGGVYTFWWVILPASDAGAHDLSQAYVESGGYEIVGKNGRASNFMTTTKGDDPIADFWALPFRDLDFDLATADVHVEIAYHGQSDDPAFTNQWMLDFWSGTACPAGDPVYNTGGTPGVFNVNGQPHCPVSVVATFGAPH